MIKLAVLAADEGLKAPEIHAQLAHGYEVLDFSAWKTWDRESLVRNIRSAEVVLTGRSSPTIPLELLEDRGRLKWLCHLHGTIKGMVDKRLIEKGLIVTNWGDAVAGVAEGAMTLLLAMLKQVLTLNDYVHGQSDRRIYQAFPCTLHNRDIGLYGFGPIGRHMARMLEGFGPNIAIYDPYAKDVPEHIRVCKTLRELFETCQIISLHCGLNAQTQKSVSRELLSLLPQGGIIINTARGDIIDEDALAAEVKAGRLLAGIDVSAWEGRGGFKKSPLQPHEGALLTGHMIGGGKGYPPGQHPKPRLPDFVVHNLEAYKKGQPLINVITADIYDLKT